MADSPKAILEMSDEKLQLWALSGDDGGYVHEIGQTAMNMRCSLRMAEASQQMANANSALVGSTRQLVRQTQNLVKATWGVVLITLVTQIAFIVLSLLRK